MENMLVQDARAADHSYTRLNHPAVEDPQPVRGQGFAEGIQEAEIAMGKLPRRQRISTNVEAEIGHAKLLVGKTAQGRAPLCQFGLPARSP